MRFLEIGESVVKSWLSRPEVGETCDKEITLKTKGLFVMFRGLDYHRVWCKLITVLRLLTFEKYVCRISEGVVRLLCELRIS